MKTKTKMLAEKYLYKTASRFFDESDNVEQLSEKTVQATLPDGRTIDVEDEDYESLEDVAPRTGADQYLGDVDTDDDISDDEFRMGKNVRVAKYTGAAKNKAAAERMKNKTAIGQEEYDRLAPAINKGVEIYVNRLLDSDENPIKYRRQTGEWEVPNLNSPIGKKIYSGLIQFILGNVINKYIENKGYTRLGKTANAIKSAFYIDFGWPDWVDKAGMDKSQNYRGAQSYVAKVLKGDKKDTNESVRKRLISACNKALTERYAKRYNVSMKEANKMFIINDR